MKLHRLDVLLGDPHSEGRGFIFLSSEVGCQTSLEYLGPLKTWIPNIQPETRLSGLAADFGVGFHDIVSTLSPRVCLKPINPKALKSLHTNL